MKGKEDLMCALRAGYPYFYFQTNELDKTIKVIKETAEELKADLKKRNKLRLDYQTAVWSYEFEDEATGESVNSDPETVLDMLEKVINKKDQVPPGTIVIAKNWNWWLYDDYGKPDKTKVSFLQNRADLFSTTKYRKILIIVSDEEFDKAIPDPLKKEFKAIEFPYPDDEEIEGIYNSICKSVEKDKDFKKPSESEKKNIIASAKGLTRSEIMKAFTFSLVKGKGLLDAKTVANLRAEEISNTPGLSMETYESKGKLLGFDRAKGFVDKWINRPDAKGIILIGPAGTGKTHFAQSMASLYNKLCIELEFAELSGGGLVGDMEAAYKRAIDVIKANANPANPILVFCDEIEKGLAGVRGAGQTGGGEDGGTSEKSAAQFLKFLSDKRPEGIYVIATCNDMSKLPAAYIRSGRWDCIFYVDFPNEPEREAILDHYKAEREIKTGAPKDMSIWTGAEIENWCRQASVMGIEEADDYVIPIRVTAKEEIDYLEKEWKPRAIAATTPVSSKREASERIIEI